MYIICGWCVYLTEPHRILFFFRFIYFMYMSVLPTHLSVHHVCIWCWAPVLCKSSKHTWLQNQLASTFFPPKNYLFLCIWVQTVSFSSDTQEEGTRSLTPSGKGQRCSLIPQITELDGTVRAVGTQHRVAQTGAVLHLKGFVNVLPHNHCV